MSDYTINENGEKVQGSSVNSLPCERSWWKILLLSLVTFGIYGIVVFYTMAKETNTSCAEDEDHTLNYLGALGLSIITCGIYGIVWVYKWVNREGSYLERHGKQAKLTGKRYLQFFGLQIALAIVSNLIALASPGLSALFSLPLIVLSFYVFYAIIQQHNEVNQNYNEI